MREYIRHGVIYLVRCPFADIRQVSCIYRTKYLLDESLLHSRHLTEQAHFLGVRDSHIGVHVGSHAVRNDERTQVSRVNENSGRN